MKQSDDQTLLAWQLSPDDVQAETCGPFATSPAQFRECGEMVPIPDSDSDSTVPVPYSMTNKGLKIELPIYESKRQRRCMAMLQCTTRSSFPARIALPILRANPEETSQYARDGRFTWPLGSVDRLDMSDAEVTKRTIFMRQEPQERRVWRTPLLVDVVGAPWLRHDSPVFFDPVRGTFEDKSGCATSGKYFAPSECSRGAVVLSNNGFEVIVLFNVATSHGNRHSCKVLCVERRKNVPNHKSLQDGAHAVIADLADHVHKRVYVGTSHTGTGVPPLNCDKSTKEHLLTLQDRYTISCGSPKSFTHLPEGGAIFAALAPQLQGDKSVMVLEIEYLKNWGAHGPLCELEGDVPTAEQAVAIAGQGKSPKRRQTI
jgi:hypothetical protein